MVDTAVLHISHSKRLLEGSEARVDTWGDGLGESRDAWMILIISNMLFIVYILHM